MGGVFPPFDTRYVPLTLQRTATHICRIQSSLIDGSFPFDLIDDFQSDGYFDCFMEHLYPDDCSFLLSIDAANQRVHPH